MEGGPLSAGNVANRVEGEMQAISLFSFTRLDLRDAFLVTSRLCLRPPVSKKCTGADDHLASLAN